MKYSLFGYYPPNNNHLWLVRFSSINIPSYSFGKGESSKRFGGMSSLTYIMIPPRSADLSILNGEAYPSMVNWLSGKSHLFYFRKSSRYLFYF